MSVATLDTKQANVAHILLVRLFSFLACFLFLWLFHTQLSPRLGDLDNRLIVLSALFAILSVSLNLINGITGQFSIGHAAFYQIGAYTTAYLTIHYHSLFAMENWMWLTLMVVCGAIAAGIAGFIVGLPSLRLRGDYLAVATLGFGEIVRIVIQNQNALGGAYGLSVPLKITPVWFVLLLLIFSIAVSRNLLKTAHGLQFLAVREDELAASAMGVNTTKTKVTAFIIGAAIAGMAGALFSHYEGFITINNFKMDQSFLILAMVVIGGTGSITGAAMAGFFLTLLPESLRDLPKIPAYSFFAFIIAAVIILLFTPKIFRGFRLERPSVQQTLFCITGFIGLIGAAYIAYWIWTQHIPKISQISITLALIGLLVALLFTRRRVPNIAVFGFILSVITLITLLSLPIKNILTQIPFTIELFSGVEYEAGKLRFPFFAVLLVVMMLSRPQGIFGHHEFSWSWVKGLFGHKKETAAVTV